MCFSSVGVLLEVFRYAEKWERYLSLNKKFSVRTVSFRLRGPDTTNQARICGRGVDLWLEQDQKEVREE